MSAINTYQRMFENVMSSGHPDQAKTLDAWQRRAITTREALMEVYKQYASDLDDINQKYSSTYAKFQREPLDEDFTLMTKIARERIIDDLNGVLDAKRKQLSQSMDAPSDEDLRLLSVLQMRNTLTDTELSVAAEKLNGNLQGLRALGDIARSRGAVFPDVPEVGDLENNLIRAEQFALESLETLSTPTDQLGYYGRCFWTAPGTGPAASFFGSVDNLTFTAPQNVKAPEPEEIPTGKQPNAARVFLTGNEALGTIAVQFGCTVSDIRAANPDKDLDHLFHGDSIVVPSTKFKFTGEAGTIGVDQVIPTYYETSAGDVVDVTQL